MARNSATLAVQECAPKPPSTSTVCFCSTAAAKLSYFQIMCTGDLTQSSTKQFIFMLKHRPTIKMRVLRRHSRHLPHTYALLRLPMGLFRGRHIFFMNIVRQVGQTVLFYFYSVIVVRRGEWSRGEQRRGV